MDISILNTPLFGLIITIAAFHIGLFVFKKTKFPVFNPLLIGIIIVMIIMSAFNIPLDYFRKGGDTLHFF